MGKTAMYTGLDGLDRRLEKYLDFDGGFFIEAGANDGVAQSNTYYFERFRGWTGVLVEPIPELAKRCAANRRNSVTVNAALVGPEHVARSNTIDMIHCNLMSLVKGALGSEERDREHIQAGEQVQGIRSFDITVRSSTLDAILAELNPRRIDLFSLDVEGYELEVLKGFDLARYRPEYLLIESIFTKAALDAYLAGRYLCIDRLSGHDWLYKIGGISS
jgi:FkbM family methyltransferase